MLHVRPWTPIRRRLNLIDNSYSGEREMRMNWTVFSSVVLLAATVVASDALAQSSRVSYGRITAVRQVELQNQDARAAGAMVGGLAGLATGSGQSSSNRALRALGGAAVGGRVAGAAGSSTGFEYTVLIGGTNTIRIVTEKAGLRVRDCVSVETGQFNNIRLAPDERCDAAAAAAAAASATVPPAAAAAADACAAATQQLLDAQTDEEFDRAERRMRLLCD
jgi:outer membrane lipoprotein SlyB